MTSTSKARNHMPVSRLSQPGRSLNGAVHCDYCAADAVWYHFAYPRDTDRDYYACDTHVGLLNDAYGDGVW